jgi:ankyrin repeat protein
MNNVKKFIISLALISTLGITIATHTMRYMRLGPSQQKSMLTEHPIPVNDPMQDLSQYFPLHDAAIAGDINALHTALTHIPVDEHDHIGKTALMYAANHGHISTVETLLNAKAQVNTSGKKFWKDETALNFAAAHGHSTITKLLLDAGAHVNDSSKINAPLAEAVNAHSFHNSNPYFINIFCTAEEIAQHNWPETVARLILAGANMNHNYHTTPRY